jgi:hypothetical protein
MGFLLCSEAHVFSSLGVAAIRGASFLYLARVSPPLLLHSAILSFLSSSSSSHPPPPSPPPRTGYAHIFFPFFPFSPSFFSPFMAVLPRALRLYTPRLLYFISPGDSLYTPVYTCAHLPYPPAPFAPPRHLHHHFLLA